MTFKPKIVSKYSEKTYKRNPNLDGDMLRPPKPRKLNFQNVKD